MKFHLTLHSETPLTTVTLIEKYILQFEDQPSWIIRAPGRINLIGEHIDYYGGSVMPAAINRYTQLILGKSIQLNSKIYSQLFDETVTLSPNHPSDSSWVKYFTCSLQVLEESGFKTEPFLLWIASDIPLGAGMSSSASLLCGFISGINQLNQWSLSQQKIAFLAQTIEHRLGTPCGLMDQYACLFGRTDAFLLMDCSNLSIQYIQVDLKEFELVLFNTQVHHHLNDGGYARRRREGEHALETLKSFYSKSGNYRDFTLSELEKIPILTDIETKRARHAISEHQRVKRFAALVQVYDWKAAGVCMYETHASLRDDYEVSCVEADFIVDQALSFGVTGARIMGGGFGGCVLCLIEKNLTEKFVSQLNQKYTPVFKQNPVFIPVDLGSFSVESIS